MTDYYGIWETNDMANPKCFTSYLGKCVGDFSNMLISKERSGCSLLAIVREEELDKQIKFYEKELRTKILK